ncbi:ECF RNA polymerase sigma factor RpoE [Pseudomonas sp. Bi70]|uniref:RNA polymerase sigma factor n=1 Tax=unclassified Pseudomonas TaxID=196821 RepID=UPI0017816D8B|nr:MULTISPECIES: RNA polymerase sigma factor [unclassified Pseudomonas]MBD9654833.1 RNA polymerase sigma factor [Pseudomonas sp. PDM12]CAH0231987.1 ECF RNA polymerase sigma factor RpoE [Pseudomonas sp. Bi70]
MTVQPPSAEPSDADLLRRYRAGDAAAFTQLYERHRLGLFRFLMGLCGDQAVAEEVFQETWMSLIRSESLQREAAVLFKTWLYQIARNRLIDHWRKQGRHQQREEAFDEQLHDQAMAEPDPERQLSLSQDQARIQAALADLPAEQREVFLLRAHGDLELHEIAELTRTPAETVKSRLRYALQKLRRLLSTAEEVSP